MAIGFPLVIQYDPRLDAHEAKDDGVHGLPTGVPVGSGIRRTSSGWEAEEFALQADLDSIVVTVGQKADTSAKNQPNGYAGLDGAGKLISSQLPSLSITSTATVASQAAQLALAAQEGDVAIRTDESKTYIHNGGSTGTMADWTLLATPADTVLSVAGKTGAVTLGLNDVSGLASALDMKAEAVDVSALLARANLIDLATDWSTGVEQSSRLSNPPDPLRFHIKHGSVLSPNKTPGSTLKVSRTEELTKASVEAAEGVANTDGLDSTPAILGASKGLKGTQVQVVGVGGMAWTEAEWEGQGNDALGIFGLGRTSGASDGVALGAYFEAQNDLGTTGKMVPVEVRIRNFRGDDSYVSSGPSNSMGLWVNVGGDFDAAAAIQVGGILAGRFDQGLAFNADSLISAALRDDSEALRVIDARGKHEFALRALKEAGAILLGAESLSDTTSQLLEISHESARNPLVKFKATKAVVQTMLFQNPSANFTIGQAANNDELMLGAVGGDGVISPGPAKSLLLGRANAVPVVTISDGFALFGKTPVAQSTGWSVSNVSTDKSFDANATSIDELADVLGTLVTYLLSRGDLAA